MLNNKDLRKKIAWMTWHSREGHIPSAYSIIDIVSYLYDGFLKFDPKNPESVDRDYFILSKGHGCSALYAVLHKIGLLTDKDLEDKNGEYARLATHPDRTKIRGVEASTGSLGNGIGFAVGVALGLKIEGKSNKVITLIGDAESNEGTVWECALLGSHLKLGNLCVVLDYNHSCDPTLPIDSPAEKWKAFGWNVIEINGHDTEEISEAFNGIQFDINLQPNVIIANTVKGKGVQGMELNYGGWHSKVPNDEEFASICKELEEYE